MLHIVLVEPEIAPNTGNIARLCAATDSRLHLVGRLGFRLDARSLRRAGVDYWEHVDWVRHNDWQSYLQQQPGQRLWFFTARSGQRHTSVAYQDGDALVFGCESRGLPTSIWESNPGQVVSIPMPSGKVRSLNLATAVGIALYEAERQLNAW
jgi:tRNA (cytidine/uridine-2'-O-)-methyltransferase